jgi:energy-coupling factor transport system permease protein
LKRGLKLTDTLVAITISIVFGVVYKMWGPLYYAVKPFGLHLDQFIYGMWFMAGTVAFLIIRKPGVALLTEIAASSGELFMGSEWGLSVLLYGIVQGICVELSFAVFRYKRFGIGALSLAAVTSTIGSLGMDFYKEYIGDLVLWNLILLISARLLGAIIISGVLAHFLVKALEATGVTHLVRPPSQQDYDALHF